MKKIAVQVLACTNPVLIASICAGAAVYALVPGASDSPLRVGLGLLVVIALCEFDCAHAALSDRLNPSPLARFEDRWTDEAIANVLARHEADLHADPMSPEATP